MTDQLAGTGQREGGVVTHFYLGLAPKARYECDLAEKAAYLVIGASVVAGFESVVFTHGAEGRELTTPDGTLLKVVTLFGSCGVVAALAFVGGAR
ncbi:hypothetical protein [Streptomyces sp. NPDC003327]